MRRKIVSLLGALALGLGALSAPAAVVAAPGAPTPPVPAGKSAPSSGKSAARLAPTQGLSHHAQGWQYIAAQGSGLGANGISVHLSNHNPHVDTTQGAFSLGEIAVGDRNFQQYFEFGWVKDAGTAGPTLFAGWRLNGAWQGWNSGCTDNAAEALDLGDAVTYTPTGSVVGSFYDYQPKRNAANTGWELTYKKVGDPTKTICTFLDTLWTSQGVSLTKIQRLQAYGETRTFHDPQIDEPCHDLGSGIFAYNNAVPPAANAGAARVNAYGWISPPAGVVADFDGINLSQAGDDPDVYRVFPVTGDPDKFYYGGVGFNSTGGTPGSLGSC
jgi:hypothetical protein